MKPTKHFALAAMFVMAVAFVLGTATPATAGPRKTQFKVGLYPPADSPLPNATGSIAVTVYYQQDYRLDGVSVSNLAPNTSYYFPLTVYDSDSGQWFGTFFQFQTNERGNWRGAVDGLAPLCGGYWGGTPYVCFDVYDSSTHTVVLTTDP